MAGYSQHTRKQLRSGILIVSACVLALVGTLHLSGSLQWLENRSADLRTKLTVQPPGDPDILLIDVDNASFSALTEKLGRWPWTRRVWQEVLRYIEPGQPKLVLFDIFFTGSEADADPGFAEQIRKSGNVILPYAFVSNRSETDQDIFAPPSSSAVETTGARPGIELSKSNWSVNRPEPSLAGAASSLGANLWTPDSDGVTRRLPLVIGYEGRSYATFWFAAAKRLQGQAPLKLENGEASSGPLQLPVDAAGNFVVHWRGDTLTAYRRIPLWELICSIYPDQCDPAVRRHAPEEFRNKLVIVGASAAGSYEVRPTAVSETAPGMFILATAIDNLLHNLAIRETPLAVTAAFLLLAIAFPASLLLRYRSILGPALGTLTLISLWAILCIYFYKQALWLPLVTPLLGAALSFTANLTFRYVAVDRELFRTRGTLERYVSPQLVSHVMDRYDDFSFKGEKKTLTILFSDVRGFTTLTEKSDPVELLAQLNEYLEAMTEIVFRYDGIVDKFIGDGIMAHWGAFTPDRPNAELAARAALEMITKLGELNQRWTALGKPTLDIGIGLNTDEVILGNVGTGKKVDFTAIGDGVNLSARLEGANKEYGTRIIASEKTLRALNGTAEVRPLGSIVVKGKTVGVKIYELLSLKNQ